MHSACTFYLPQEVFTLKLLIICGDPILYTKIGKQNLIFLVSGIQMVTAFENQTSCPFLLRFHNVQKLNKFHRFQKIWMPFPIPKVEHYRTGHAITGLDFGQPFFFKGLVPSSEDTSF